LTGAVFLVVIVIAVLSYRFFAGPADGAGESSGRTGTDPRPAAPRGREVTPAMVEVMPPPLLQKLIVLGHTSYVPASSA